MTVRFMRGGLIPPPGRRPQSNELSPASTYSAQIAPVAVDFGVGASRKDHEWTSSGYPDVGLLKPDPVPAEVVSSARALFESDRPSELATLVSDSLLDSDEQAQKHTLRFQHDRVELQLYVSSGSPATLIQGVLDRPGTTHVRLYMRNAGREVATPVEGATFEAALPGHGLVRISLEREGEPTVWTEWFRI